MTMADFFVIACIIFAAAATFMTYESRGRDEQFGEYMTYGVHVLIGFFVLVNGPTFNEAYFHFTGFVGHFVAAILIYTVLVLPVHLATNYVCKNWLHKKVLQSTSEG